MKGWFISSVILTIVYYVFGIFQVGAESPLCIWTFLISIVSLIGIIYYKRGNYKATKMFFIISGIMGIPFGILLIIAGIKINKLAKERAIQNEIIGKDNSDK